MIILADILTEFLIDELKKRGYIHVFWQRDDVETSIKELGFEPSEEAITAIVKNIEHYHDASSGINWDVIGVHVQEYYKPRDENT